MTFLCLPKQHLPSKQEICWAVLAIMEIPWLIDSGIQVEVVVVEYGVG